MSGFWILRFASTSVCVFALLPASSRAATPESMPLVAADDFAADRGAWEFLDPKSWNYKTDGGRSFLSQHVREATYAPPHRSPFHAAILKDHVVGDFELTASVRSTVEDYGHRDVCMIFGYVDPAHFYYVHIGKQTDPHCNQIFIVDGEPRKKISLSTTEGTNWTDDWHRVRVTRDVDTGRIEVYFDDFKQPIMTAEDKTFAAGRVGLGSFDDSADWDDFQLLGIAAELPPSTTKVIEAE